MKRMFARRASDLARENLKAPGWPAAGWHKRKQPDSTLDPTAGEPDGFWGAAFGLSGAIFPPGASLAAVYHPTDRAIDVFGVDNNGALQDIRREKLPLGTPFWQPPVPLTGPGF